MGALLALRLVGGGERPARQGQAADHDRHEGLHRGVRVGELYAQALRAKGYTVNLKKNIGSTEIIDKALTSNTIDAYPEYTGETVTSTFGKNVRTSSREKLTNLAKQLYAERGQETSNPTPFEDVDAIIALRQFAQKNNLKTVADLKKLSSFTLAGRRRSRVESPA